MVCPRCGGVGYLSYNPRIGFYVKHRDGRTCYVPRDTSLEVLQYFDKPRQFLRYMGSDYHILKYLLKMVPPHRCYVEVFGGSAVLLLNKSPSKVEVYNDVDNDLVNLFVVIRDRFDVFIRKLRWIPYARTQYYEFLKKYDEIEDPVDKAVATYFILKASFAGKFGKGFGTSKVTNHAKAFYSSIEELELLRERLTNVIIENLDFREVIKRYDSKETFFYLDPPHLYISTERSLDYLKTGFTVKDYMDLLKLLESIEGKFLLKQTLTDNELIRWARRNGFRVRMIRFKLSAGLVRDAERREETYIFVANYRI